MNRRRVAVTGLGAVTPLGNSVADSWRALLDGKSGIGPIARFDASAYSVRFAGEVRGFSAADYMSVKESRHMDAFIHYALAAAAEAVKEAGLDSVSDEDAPRIGVSVGSGIGGLELIEKNHAALAASGPRRISPFFVPATIINMAAGHISIKYNFQGPGMSLVSACTTGAHCIGNGMRLIQWGDADVMVCGGAEAAITPLGVGGFAAARALSQRNDDPEGASRPFDAERDGFVLGEGAGVLILEEMERAKKRGATIYAELAGYGASSDAFHMTAPCEDGRGACAGMTAALADSSLSADAIAHINAHATATPLGDVAETLAIRKTLGAHAERVAVSATKSMTGHLLGAAGGIEAVFAALAVRENVAPPTINLQTPDPACDLDYVANAARQMPIGAAMSNSFGFGGANASLVFRAV